MYWNRDLVYWEILWPYCNKGVSVKRVSVPIRCKGPPWVIVFKEFWNYGFTSIFCFEKRDAEMSQLNIFFQKTEMLKQLSLSYMACINRILVEICIFWVLYNHFQLRKENHAFDNLTNFLNHRKAPVWQRLGNFGSADVSYRSIWLCLVNFFYHFTKKIWIRPLKSKIFISWKIEKLALSKRNNTVQKLIYFSSELRDQKCKNVFFSNRLLG